MPDLVGWNDWVSVRNEIFVEESATTTTTTLPPASTTTTTTLPPTSTTTTTTLPPNLTRVRPVFDAPFPPKYTPAWGFWLRSLIRNCSIPWEHPGTLMEDFWLGGGYRGEGGLMSVTSGLQTLAQAKDFYKTKVWGLGYSSIYPQMGYCIGKYFKQEVYVQFDVAN